MNPGKLLAICVLGAAAAITAGCASSPASPSVAAAQRNIQSGKVTAVETVAVVEQSAATSSSGSSAVVTTAASGGPIAVTVQFGDGSERRYIIEHPSAAYTIGQPVNVITNGDNITIVGR